MEIKNLEIELLPGAGCNNGVYPTWEGTFDSRIMAGITCRCRRGCSNLDRIENHDHAAGTADITPGGHWDNDDDD